MQRIQLYAPNCPKGGSESRRAAFFWYFAVKIQNGIGSDKKKYNDWLKTGVHVEALWGRSTRDKHWEMKNKL